MQQYPGGRASQPAHTQSTQHTQRTQIQRTQRTQPALPGASIPTTPHPARQGAGAPALKRTLPRHSLRAALKLLGIGLLLEALFLALYPLLAGVTPDNDGAKQGLQGLFPWLPRLYWSTAFPALVQALSHVPLFNLTESNGNANLFLALICLALLFVLLAARVGSSVLRNRVARGEVRALYWMVLCFTTLFGVTFLFSPPVLAQNLFLYGFYGHIVAVYHLNPYLMAPASFPRDPLYALLATGTQSATPLSGPVWIDMSIPIALLAHNSVANILLDFRLSGLIVHIINTMLIWAILSKQKPETRVAATLLYGWNPLVLLFSIAAVQQEVILVLFLLLAVLFFQRNSFLLGWVFLLLAALVNVLCLLLLPLFFRLLQRETRLLSVGRRWLWWLSCLGISALVVVLAFAPYWRGWGIAGLLALFRQAFWPASAFNSLDAALINLPGGLLPAFSWLVVPHHWLLFAAIAVGLLLLIGFWLIDTLELALLFSSWVLLTLFIFFPTCWPWLLLVPLSLSLCSAHSRTLLLTMLLLVGACVSTYSWLIQPLWQGQALLTIGLPVLLWGWVLFFTSTWHMTRASNDQELSEAANAQGGRAGLGRGLSRPSWPARSWASRPSRPGRTRL